MESSNAPPVLHAFDPTPGGSEVPPGTAVRATVVDRGWELVVSHIGPLGAELRWPDVLVPPFRGTVLSLRLTLGATEGVASARVTGLHNDGDPGMRVSVIWEEGPARPVRTARRPRWAVPPGGPAITVLDPVSSRWGPPMRIVDTTPFGLGFEAEVTPSRLVPGLVYTARLCAVWAPSYPIRLKVTRARVRVGPDGEVVRLGAEVVDADPRCAEVLAEWFFREADGCTPALLAAGNYPIDAVAGMLTWAVQPLPDGVLQLTMDHRGTHVGGALITRGAEPGHAVLDAVWIDDAYRCTPIQIALWQRACVAVLERGCTLLSGEDREGIFQCMTHGRPAFRVDLPALLTGAGQSPREWRRWHAAAYEAAAANGGLRPGVWGVARAALYSAMAR